MLLWGASVRQIQSWPQVCWLFVRCGDTVLGCLSLVVSGCYSAVSVGLFCVLFATADCWWRRSDAGPGCVKVYLS